MGKVQETGLGFCFKGCEACSRVENSEEDEIIVFTIKSGPTSKSLD